MLKLIGLVKEIVVIIAIVAILASGGDVVISEPADSLPIQHNISGAGICC